MNNLFDEKEKYSTFDPSNDSIEDTKITINEEKKPEQVSSSSTNNASGAASAAAAAKDTQDVPITSKLLGKMKGMLNFGSDENSSVSSDAVESGERTWKDKVVDWLKNAIEIEKSYKNFFIILGVGVALLFLSLIFLIISPIKFVALFSLGSLVIISSFIFIYGTEAYFKKLFSKERFPFTVLYVSSVILGFFFVFIKGYFLISLILSLAQLVTLIIFVLTFIPGGKSGINFIMNMVKSPFSSAWMRMTGGSYLPQ